MQPGSRPLSPDSGLSDSMTLLSSRTSSPPSVRASRTTDAVAIVGLACRVAGSSNANELWRNIIAKKDVQRKMPADRFNVDTFYHPDGSNKGTTNAQHGYFLDQDLRDFDASFFHISGKEAAAMDPQQRLLLEVVYEALEDAGIPVEDIDGSQTSVYCGSFTNDYYSMTMRDLASYPKYTVTGTGNSILANRISYFYNLHGASATIDTACSSSLVCLHLGAQSLKSGESDISIVVGSALHFLEDSFITMTDLGMLSPEGRCRSFDADGRGYARGEGVCAVVLKRQIDAERQGDHIRALVRGSLVNHDGTKQGITLPSAEAQEALIRQTYKNAGLDPDDTQYIEAHGTGTARGDPVETRAIGAVFGQKTRSEPLYIGSVKSNIGHLEGASGLAGVIKVVLSLEHEQIPPNMHFQSPNPQISFKEWKLKVPQQLTEWPSTVGCKRASINSFGYGGTNAHVILEEYKPLSWIHTGLPPVRLSEQHVQDHGRAFLVTLTSHSDGAGQLTLRRLVEYIRGRPALKIADLAQSLCTRRSMHNYRAFTIANSPSQILQHSASVVWKTRSSGSMPRRLAFVFTGQGAQWWAMGRQLIQQSPLVLNRLQYCDTILQTLPDAPEWSVVAELLRPEKESRIAQETRLSQPLCTALQLALVDILGSWRIVPSATVGHSSGEIAAAYAAGILSFESSIIAAYYRGLHMSTASSALQGGMMAVNLSPSQAQDEIKQYGGKIVIGALNSPSNVTLSGDLDAIIELRDALTARSIFARQLKVTQAFHSPHMFPLAPAYERALGKCPRFRAQPAAVRMFSSVTARVADADHMGPAYWASNMTGTVRFADALVGTVLDEEDRQNVDVLIEIGPHPALKGPSRQVLESINLQIPYLASLTRDQPAYEALLQTAGELFQLGYPVDLPAVNSDQYADDHGMVESVSCGTILRDLPSYAWDHQQYWAETRMVKAQRDRPSRHVLLGSMVEPSIPSHPRWRNFLRLQEVPWLRDHAIDGQVIFPAAGYIAMAVEGIVAITTNKSEIEAIKLREVAIKAPLPLNDDDDGVEVLMELKPAGQPVIGMEFIIVSFTADARCVEHCSGIVSISREAAELDPVAVDELRSTSSSSAAPGTLYQSVSKLGLEYGPSFQLVSGTVEMGSRSALGPLTFPARKYISHSAEHTILHPTLLDASFHLVFAALQASLGRPLDQPYVPTTIRSLQLTGGFLQTASGPDEQEYLVNATIQKPGSRAAVHDLAVMGQGESKDRQLRIEGLECVSLGTRKGMDQPRSLFFRNRWYAAFDMLQDGTTVFTSLVDLVDLFLHQHPNTHILHFTPNIAQAKEVLAVLGGGRARRRCQSFTPIFSPNVSYHGELQQLDNSALVNCHEPTADGHDLLIITTLDAATDQIEYAHEGGFIITRNDVEHPALSRLYTSQGFTVWRKQRRSGPGGRSLLILMPSMPCQRTEDIAETIQSHYGSDKVSFATLADPRAISSHDTILVLSSLGDNALLEDPTDYNAVRSLFTAPTSRRIIWVLEGSAIAPTNPEHAIIVGLARSARSENDQLRLLTVDVTPDAGVEPIVHLLNAQVAERDDEIAVRDGVLLIPRVYADDELNSKLYNGFNSRPSLADRPIGLATEAAVRSPGYQNEPLFQPDKQYLLVGGLGGIGRTLAEWLVRRGARDLVFFSRSGIERPDAKATVAMLKRRQVRVSVVQGDVANYEDVERCIQSLPRLAGLFQAAMVLQDSPLATMTHAQWQRCMQPKVEGTKNLHLATLDRALDFFVCFSSVSAIIGTRGQANYSAANTFMDALMAHRRSLGLPGSTMNCGMITGVGVVAENQTLQKDMERMGYDAVNEYELLCQIEEAVSNVNAPETITGLNLARQDLYWATKPILRNLYANHDWDVSSGGKDEEVPLLRLLHEASNSDIKTKILLDAFVATISKTLVIPLEQIQAAKPLSSYGLDSLVAMEIRKWFSATVEVELPLFEILASPSIAHLVDRAILSLPSIPQTQSTTTGSQSPLPASSSSSDSIGKADMSKPIPMTPQQARMWLAHTSASSESSLNLTVVCRLQGNPDTKAIGAAFESIKQDNAILRTGYRQTNGFYEQFITDNTRADLVIHDFRGLSDPEALLAEIVKQEKATPVDIANGKPMRLILVHLTEREHALICVVHHIAIDGGSTQPIIRQWVQIYNSLRGNKSPVSLSAPPVSYCDFAVWHQDRRQASMETDLAFWKEYLADLPVAYKLLPFAKCERPPVRDTTRAYVHGGLIPLPLMRRMKRICRETQATPVDFLLTAFRAFIFRHTRDEDLIFLLVNGTRPHPALEDVIGCFIDLTPLRFHDPNCDELAFEQLLTVTHRRNLQALSHGHVPFLDILRALSPPLSTAHIPVGQIYVNYYMHGPTPVYKMSDCTISDVKVYDIPSASELSLGAVDDPEAGLRMSLQYATSLYRAEDMQRFLDGLSYFLQSAIKDHRQPIKEIGLGGDILKSPCPLPAVDMSKPASFSPALRALPLESQCPRSLTHLSRTPQPPSVFWMMVMWMCGLFVLLAFANFLYTSFTYLPLCCVYLILLHLIVTPTNFFSPIRRS